MPFKRHKMGKSVTNKLRRGIRLRESELKFVFNSEKCIQFMIANKGLEYYISFHKPWLFVAFFLSTKSSVVKLIFESNRLAIDQGRFRQQSLLHFIASVPSFGLCFLNSTKRPQDLSAKYKNSPPLFIYYLCYPFIIFCLKKTRNLNEQLK